MTDLILHYAPDNASLCVRLALEAAGLPYKTCLVDRRAKAQKSADYLRLNPNGLIPVLETPDGPIFETAAILFWLADRHPSLLPDAGPERTQACTWLIWMSNTLHPTLRMLFYPDQYIAAAHRAALAEVTRTRLNAQLQLLDEALSDASWIGGAAPTILDCYLCPMLRWMQLYPQDAPTHPRLTDYPALLGIAKRSETYPGSRIAQHAEGLGSTPFSDPKPCDPPEGAAL